MASTDVAAGAPEGNARRSQGRSPEGSPRYVFIYTHEGQQGSKRLCRQHGSPSASPSRGCVLCCWVLSCTVCCAALCCAVLFCAAPLELLCCAAAQVVVLQAAQVKEVLVHYTLNSVKFKPKGFRRSVSLSFSITQQHNPPPALHQTWTKTACKTRSFWHQGRPRDAITHTAVAVVTEAKGSCGAAATVLTTGTYPKCVKQCKESSFCAAAQWHTVNKSCDLLASCDKPAPSAGMKHSIVHRPVITSYPACRTSCASNGACVGFLVNPATDKCEMYSSKDYACTVLPKPKTNITLSTKERCEGGYFLQDGYEYQYNDKRGTHESVCGNCACCRRPQKLTLPSSSCAETTPGSRFGNFKRCAAGTQNAWSKPEANCTGKTYWYFIAPSITKTITMKDPDYVAAAHNFNTLKGWCASKAVVGFAKFPECVVQCQGQKGCTAVRWSKDRNCNLLSTYTNPKHKTELQIDPSQWSHAFIQQKPRVSFSQLCRAACQDDLACAAWLIDPREHKCHLYATIGAAPQSSCKPTDDFKFFGQVKQCARTLYDNVPVKVSTREHKRRFWFGARATARTVSLAIFKSLFLKTWNAWWEEGYEADDSEDRAWDEEAGGTRVAGPGASDSNDTDRHVPSSS
eukprot:TRINITY_DN3581_c0_g1_i18.p1 TRINITY_DN3581_c0_g1~~TRINITY_DN3581_c0_g1_i18.p1  ORF type:complete len:629 (-),score=132.48 TRINITY_DN3581_c0_g1_i18:275-2161(-)